MSGVATAIAGAAIIGGTISYINSSNANDAQQQAAQSANQTQTNEFNEQMSAQAPWRFAGQRALSEMADPYFQQTFNMSDFQQDPGYQFDLQQGQQAIERSAAARGGLASGGMMKDMANYTQGMASNEYQNAYNRFNNDQTQRFNRLASQAQIGQTANGQAAQVGMNTANNISANTIGAGNAAAASQIAQGNIVGGGTSNLGGSMGNYLMQQQMLSAYNNNMNNYGSMPMNSGYMAAPSNNYGSGQITMPELGSSTYGSGSDYNLGIAGS